MKKLIMACVVFLSCNSSFATGGDGESFETLKTTIKIKSVDTTFLACWNGSTRLYYPNTDSDSKVYQDTRLPDCKSSDEIKLSQQVDATFIYELVLSTNYINDTKQYFCNERVEFSNGLKLFLGYDEISDPIDCQ